MNKEIIIPFAGFYHSIHSHELDYQLEQQFQNDQGDILSQVLFDKAYEAVDWYEIHISYAKLYTEWFAELFELKTLTFKLLSSPRYYNFETDRIFCEIDTSELEPIYLKADKDKLDKVVRDNFTSCSGFISHYPPDLIAWPVSVGNWDHNQLGTLLEAYIESHENYKEHYDLDFFETYQDAIYGLVQSGVPEKLYNLGRYLYERTQRGYKRRRQDHHETIS